MRQLPNPAANCCNALELFGARAKIRQNALDDTMTLLSIPDMSCGHCKATVEAALGAVPGVREVKVDLVHRNVEVSGDASGPDLLAAAEAAGYPATLSPG